MSTRIGLFVSILFRTTVIVVLLAVASWVAYWLTMSRPIPPSVGQVASSRGIDVVQVASEEVARTWIGYGSAEAIDSVDVPCEVSSIVLEIPEEIEIGRMVSKGALITQLDSEDFQRQEDIAERTLRELATRMEQLDLDEENAHKQVGLSEQEVSILEDELARVREAHDNGAATNREVDLVRQRLIQAQSSATNSREHRDSIPLSRQLLETQESSQRATRDMARRNVDRCRITSPIEGVIELVDIEIGERVDPMMRIARIVDPMRIVVPIRLPSSARDSIGIGDKAALRAGGAIDRMWIGDISRISPVDDVSTRTMTVFVEPQGLNDAQASKIAPGTFVSATVISTVTTRRFVVPRSAVRNERVWYLDENNRVKSMKVEVEFPLESTDGSERRLVLRTLLPEGALVVIDATRSPPQGTEVKPNVRSDKTATASGITP
jgi:HlyD family secretion protein